MERFPIPIKQLLEGRLTPKKRRRKSGGQIFPSVAIVDLTPHHALLKKIGAVLTLILVIVLVSLIRDARTKFLPNTTIADVAVGGLTQAETLTLLQKTPLTPPAHTIELTAQGVTVASSSAELDAHFQYDQAVAVTLQFEQKNTLNWLRELLFPTKTIHSQAVPIAYDSNKLKFMVTTFKQKLDSAPHQPSAKLTLSGVTNSIVIDPGKNAFTVKPEETLASLTTALSQVTSQTLAENKKISVETVTDTLSQQLTDEQIKQARDRASKLVGERLVFERDHNQETLKDTQLIPLLNLPDGYQVDRLDDTLQAWAQELNRGPQDAEFVYDPKTLKVSTFVPDRKGLALDIPAVKRLTLEGLKELEGTDTKNLKDARISKDLSLIETAPNKTLASTNNLGINERIGFGESYYYHSIPTRIHNVAHTTEKINLTLVAPGAEFSFNKTLGDVSSLTGFQPAYVIKDGQTILGDGGGVCQVSSTLFRALLDSGLKITRRLPHSYRVSYYELDRQPGFDATVYAGEVDLRFINDTDHYVLIYGQTDSANLHMFIELYGTSDGRTTEISNYQAWDPTPPLPTQYVPDPTLPHGKLKQIDWSASGIKTKFTHTIRDKNGKIISQKDYVSTYRSWAAKYLQGI